MTIPFPAFRTSRFLGVTALAAVLATPVLADDLTVVSKVTTRGKTTTATNYLTEQRVRYSDGQSDVLVDFGAERYVLIDHKKKTWSEITFAELHEMMAEAARMFDEMPPMVTKMLGDITDAKVEKLGGSREIAGYRCNEYRVTLGTKISYELCAAPDLDPPMNYYEARKMGNLALGPMASRMTKLYDAMAAIDGYPIATDMDMEMMGINVDVDQEATDIRHSVPTDAFDIPSSYKKKKWKK